MNVAESLAIANIATEGLLGTSVPQMVTGSGPGSLRAIAANPEGALKTLSANAMNVNNLIDIGFRTALTKFGFKFAKRALRSSIREINKPIKMLSLGVKL